MPSIDAWTTGLIDLLAASATWQELCGVTGRADAATLARANISRETAELADRHATTDGKLNTLQIQMPLAIVILAEHRYDQRVVGGLNPLDAAGQVDLILAIETPHPEDFQASYLQVHQHVGGIIDDLAAAIPASPTPFVAIDMIQPPIRSTVGDRTDGNDYFWCRYSFAHSVEGAA